MRRKLLIIISLCLSAQMAFADSSDSTQNAVQQDTSIVERRYLDVIEQCDSISWVLLDPMSEWMSIPTICLARNEYGLPEPPIVLPDCDGIWPSYLGETLRSKQDTVQERIRTCIETLTYAGSFVKSDMVKESTFLPDIAVWFHANGKDVVFSYSFYCDLCRFNDEQSYQELDGEIIRKCMISFACSVFPDDRYLRNIKRRER